MDKMPKLQWEQDDEQTPKDSNVDNTAERLTIVEYSGKTIKSYDVTEDEERSMCCELSGPQKCCNKN